MEGITMVWPPLLDIRKVLAWKVQCQDQVDDEHVYLVLHSDLLCKGVTSTPCTSKIVLTMFYNPLYCALRWKVVPRLQPCKISKYLFTGTPSSCQLT